MTTYIAMVPAKSTLSEPRTWESVVKSGGDYVITCMVEKSESRGHHTG